MSEDMVPVESAEVSVQAYTRRAPVKGTWDRVVVDERVTERRTVYEKDKKK